MSLRWPRCTDLPSIFEYKVCGACDAWSIKTVLCTSCTSITREFRVTAIMKIGSEILDYSLFYAAVAMLSAMPDFVPDNMGLSMKARSPEHKVGVSRRRQL